MRNTSDPIYQQEFYFKNVVDHDKIVIQVREHTHLPGVKTFMGEIRLMAKDFIDGNESWFPLEKRLHKADKAQGDLLLRFKLCYSH